MMEEKTLQQISQEYGTPAYIFDLDAVKARLQQIKEELGDQIRICYAMKANPFLVKEMINLVDGFEVCSPGEFRICERAQIPVEQIVLSGVYKEKQDIKRILNSYEGKGIFTIESLQQLELLAHSAKEEKQMIHVLIRLTGGNQFGMDKEALCEVIKNRDRYSYLNFKGIQYYSGTQKRKLSGMGKELKELYELCLYLKENFDYQAEELEYGPGFYIPYFQNEKCEDEELLLRTFRDVLDKLQFKGKITLEIGRFLVAKCGYYLTSIVEQKRNLGQNYCIVDGGIHHVNYYGQTMAMKMPYALHLATEKKGEIENWNICGSLCTISDVIVKQFPLKNAQINDVIVFENTGAYSVTEGISLFLSRDLPKILFYSEKAGVQLIRDTQVTDIINSI